MSNLPDQAPAAEMPEHLVPLFEKCQRLHSELTEDQLMLVELMMAEKGASVWGIRNFSNYEKMIRDAQIAALQKSYDAGRR